MKTPEEILRDYTELAHNLALNDYKNEIYCIELSDAIQAMEAYHSQFSQPSDVSDEEMYDYISFANYFHKWKEKIQRGACPIRPDEVFLEWQKSDYRNECKELKSGQIKPPVEGDISHPCFGCPRPDKDTCGDCMD